MSLLEVRKLRLDLETSRGTVKAVRSIDFTVEEGEVVAIVGESGCGKTMTCLSVLNLFPKDNGVIAGESSILFEGKEIAGGSEKMMQKIRGARIGMVFQDPMKALNPTEKTGEQIMDILREHKKISRREAREEAIRLLEKVGILEAARRCEQYPHELSGGMRQRVVIAMAVACRPALLIADEPTTALDVTIQAQVLGLLKELKQEFKMAVLLVTHNLGVVASMADRVLVMYGGKILEEGSAKEIFQSPQHPYTKALLHTIPKEEKRRTRLKMIPGTPPNLLSPPKGCPFLARCRYRMQICSESFPVGYTTERAKKKAGEEGESRGRCHCFLLSPEYQEYQKQRKRGGQSE